MLSNKHSTGVTSLRAKSSVAVTQLGLQEKKLQRNYSLSTVAKMKGRKYPIVTNAQRRYQADQWSEKLDRLRRFRQKHRHCLVPCSYDPDPSLARWVRRQRYHYHLHLGGKPSPLKPDRIEILNSIGFQWDAQEAQWRERLLELKEFKEQYGHTAVPSSYPANQKLATWVKFQRQQYRRYEKGDYSSYLTKERIAVLDDLDFVWNINVTTVDELEKQDHRNKIQKVTPEVSHRDRKTLIVNALNQAESLQNPSNCESSIPGAGSSLNLFRIIAQEKGKPSSTTFYEKKLVLEAWQNYAKLLNEKNEL